MKPIQIDFMEDKRWQWVWTFAVLFGACLMGWASWQWQKTSSAVRDTENRIGVARQQLELLNAPKEIRLNPKQAGAEQAVKLLQQDLNKVFATVENLAEPGTRLRNLSLDGASGILRLEFELDSMNRAASLTTIFNTGYEHRPWQLESVSGAASNNPIGFATAQTIRGIWTVQLDKL